MLRDRIYCILPLCMDRATKQTCSIQVHNETVPDLGIIVELLRPGVAESKTGKAREQNHILQFPEYFG